MKLCNENSIRAMIESGELRIESEHNDIIFLDDFRLGLRLLDQASFAEGTADLSKANESPLSTFSLSQEGLGAGQFALGKSAEKISLPSHILGFMNTRSKYARLGLELLQSSWLAAPGFGNGHPTPIVFEMQARRRITGFSQSEPYAFLMLFALDEPLRLDGRMYHMRFPLYVWKEG